MMVLKTAAFAVVLTALVGTAFGADPAASEWWPFDPLPPASRHSLQIDGLGVVTMVWATPVTSWTIYPDGSGWYIWRRPVENSRRHIVVTKHLDAAAGRYQQIEDLIRLPETYAGPPPPPVIFPHLPTKANEANSLPCDPSITDAPYGEVQWRRSGETRLVFFNYGCTSGEGLSALKQIRAANAIVASWADSIPAIDEREAD